MKQFDEWLFQINVPEGKDAHHALVQWLRRNNLGELFTESYKAITYVVYQNASGYSLIAKSCIAIDLPHVEHHYFELDLDQPVKVAVQLSTKRKVRPPNLLHESQSSTRTKTTIRLMTDTEKQERIQGIIDELGFDPDQVSFEIVEGIGIPVLHKRQKLFILEPTMNVVIQSKVADPEKFEKAWCYGVGNKRVYGLGCVRVLQDE
ncbi:hypothetical protein [Acinetobacter radioresistens]|uniref:hypothetical protein n=1 Tax=Acinetobacter radioresistens TaxID=40216 RepID=UPI00028E125B|nr:hypothetical protein [Acinetobacter radioresistens]BBL22144.1 hypothetical protein ACRAD_28150 [Acinetobacter radioresistens DSM 6976 = NBRC 102413 = CIP 103788]